MSVISGNSAYTLSDVCDDSCAKLVHVADSMDGVVGCTLRSHAVGNEEQPVRPAHPRRERRVQAPKTMHTTNESARAATLGAATQHGGDMMISEDDAVNVPYCVVFEKI